MTVKEELKLEGITTDYYSCKLCKVDHDITFIFNDAKLIFNSCLIFKCGYPNEEIYMHYDYYVQDSMKKFHLYEIQESEWIKGLTKINKVHQRHTDEIFNNERHFIILFEDEVFECIALSYQIVQKFNG